MWSCSSCRFSLRHFLVPTVWSAWIGLLAFPNVVWSTCGFGSFPSVYATMNKTVMIECRSNCTPIRILHIDGGSETEVTPQSEYSLTNTDYPYISVTAIHLDLTYNDTYLVCKAVNEPSQPSTELAQVLLQDLLLPVENLRPTFNATHIQFKWEPPPVLEGIELRYKIYLLREGVVIINETVNRTSVVVRFNCPCQPSFFAVTPVAGLLVGEERVISPNCTKEDPKVSIDSDGFRKHSTGNRRVRIAFKIQTYDSWCVPSTAVMNAVCQHTQASVNYTFRHFKSENSIIKLLSPISASLPPQDFCEVSLALEYSNGHKSSLHKPFNISLFDTQFITVDLMKNYPTLCVTCHFAPWARGVESCVIHVHIPSLSYHDSEVANKNKAGEGLECFPGLPTDRTYTVYIVVYDDDQRYFVAVYDRILINFTSSHPPVINPANDDDNTLWEILGPCLVILVATLLIGLAIFLICKFFVAGSSFGTLSLCSNAPKGLSMDHIKSPDADTTHGDYNTQPSTSSTNSSEFFSDDCDDTSTSS